jgi:uncharacterized protein (TIRG00374 family)
VRASVEPFAGRGPAASSRVRWILRLSLGLGIFWLAFHDVDVAAMRRTFQIIDLRWIGAAVVSVLVTVTLVGIRWRILLGVDSGPEPRRVLLSAVIVSQAANIVMPFKLGDAVRIGAVSRALQLPPAQVFSSVAVERLFDGLTAGLTAIVLIVIGELPGYARGGLASFVMAVSLALVLTVVLARSPEILTKRLAWPARLLPSKIRNGLRAQIEMVLLGLERASKPRALAGALVTSVGIAFGSVVTVYLVMQAFAFNVPALAAAAVAVASQVGNAVVPVPGAAGVAQVVAVGTLRLWNVPEAPALAFALMLYLVSRVPKIALLPLALPVLMAHPSEAA